MTIKIQLLCIVVIITLVTVCCTGITQENCSSISTNNKFKSPVNLPVIQDSTSSNLFPVNTAHQWNNTLFHCLKQNEKKGDEHPWPKFSVANNNGGLFSWRIALYTNFEGNEKYTPVLESILEGIDVDNNPETGLNGKDIKIEFYIIPFPDLMDGEWILFLSSFLKVTRLGEEIKYGDFELYLEVSFTLKSMHTLRIGYSSPKNQEIPKELNEIITVIPYLYYDKQPEFNIDMVPLFDDGVHDISILAEYIHQGTHRVTIDYVPAVDTKIHVIPHGDQDTIDFSIQRISSDEQKIRINYEGLTSLGLFLEDIPQIMTFTLGFGENIFEYISSDTFNATLFLAVFDLELFMIIDYLPQHLKTRFAREEGYFFISITDSKTQFILSNDYSNPTKSFTITNLTGESLIQWLITQKEGYVTIEGFKGLEISISLTDNEYSLLVTSILETKYFKIRWKLSIPGFVFLDTNHEWLNSCSFQLIFNTLYGILLEASILQAEDFQANWQKTIPLFTYNGSIDFLGDFTFKIYLNGIWYPIF